MSDKVPFGFKTVAKQTVTSFSVVAFLCKEPPINWYFSCIAKNRSEHTPKEHDKHYVKCNQHDDTQWGVSQGNILKNEYEIAETDEESDCKKVRVEEFW